MGCSQARGPIGAVATGLCHSHSNTGSIKKMWYIYTMEYYSAIKRNEIPAFLATWMDLEIIMLSEVSHTMRHQHQMLSLTCRI
ncbi:DUF1725 domain-containing protein [Escherichia coli]|nr:DUF1725 domain-containing protein [Escherichia coli]